MHVSDLIEINATQTDAAVVLNHSIANPNLVACFAPTKASTAVLAHLQKAVLPEATQEMRAINLFGNYGSGKSHLAVLIAQLFRDGAGSAEFTGFFQRLTNAGYAKLADELRHTFLLPSDPDARPYLLVTLYGSETPSLAAKLYEGLYQTLTRHPSLDPKTILPKTEYDVCIQRFEEIVEIDGALAKADLVQWQLAEHYLTTAEMQAGLKRHEPEALEAFKRWHEEVCKGAAFNPVSLGGKNFIEAYQEAGKNLAEQHSFGGILVVWDEFGFALEDLLNNPRRDALNEINNLQSFVQTVCQPRQGHTVFIGLTHVSFVEYAARTGANDTIKNRLETIAGRFYNKPFKIELNASESEGYHLLAMQKTWTSQGEQYWQQTFTERQPLLESCAALPLFKILGSHLADVLKEVYPLHPVMAAGLFALSDFAQSTRTALTFFRDNADKLLAREIKPDGLFVGELVRLPELADYYAESLKEKAANDWNRFQRASHRIPADLPATELQAKQNILKLLLLAQLPKLLGDNFQATELFLACALYDAKPSTSATLRLSDDLAWLKAAGLVWKNDVTGEWLLHGEASADVEKLIPDKLELFAGRSAETLFKDYPDMLADVLPMTGIYDLEPSVCGIVRSYQVSLLKPPISNQLKLDNLTLSASVFLVLANSVEDVGIVKSRIAEMKLSPLYFWLPTAGIDSETVAIDDRDFNLTGLLCRYLVLQLLLKEKTASDDLRRQLTAKWEKNRQDLVQILRLLFGRDGLEVGKCSIHQAGTTNAIACSNWHEFRGFLAAQVQAEYSQEIPIRANNMNKLNNEKYTGRSDVKKIVERILGFATHPAYQTDLLGNAETSEKAALIDGVLGVNQLFIERPTGWDIRKIDETDSKVKEVLKLLRDSLLRKREQPYLVKDLRDKLVAPPFGLPACTLALFAAVAVRDEVKRLRWGSTNEADFAINLTGAFNQDSKLTIRLFEFSTKQLAILSALSHYFKLRKGDQQSYEEFASQAVLSLRRFVNEQPEAVQSSGQLNGKTKELVKFLQQVGKSQQEVAEFLLRLLVLDKATENDIATEGHVKVKELLDDFERISHAKQHELKKTVQTVLATTQETYSRLLANLTHPFASPKEKAIAELFKGHGTTEDISPDKVTLALLNKAIEDCTEIEIGQCQGVLKTLVEQNQRDPESHSATNNHVAEPITTKQQLVVSLQKYIQTCRLANDDIATALRTILADYE